MSFVKSLPILRNLFGCSAASYTKTNRPGDTVMHVQVMPGATLKYEPIMFDSTAISDSSRFNNGLFSRRRAIFLRCADIG